MAVKDKLTDKNTYYVNYYSDLDEVFKSVK